jgi:hypothetical protein
VWDSGVDLKGDPGPAGAVGPTGAQGVPGQTGPQGTQGPSGPAGPTGAQGPAGSTGLTFKGSYSSSATYAVNDSVASGGVQYFSKVGSNSGHTPNGEDAFWGILVNAGPTGPQGPAGATGAQGPIGATGPQGTQGPAGPTGPAGATGAQGAVGATGAAGPTGPTGATGPAGAAGTDGSGIYKAPNAGKTDFLSGTSMLYVGTKADLDATFAARGVAPAATDLVRYTDPIRFADGIRASTFPIGEATTAVSYTLVSGTLHLGLCDVKADGPIDQVLFRLSTVGTSVTYCKLFAFKRNGGAPIAMTADISATMMSGAVTKNIPWTNGSVNVNPVDGLRLGILSIFTGTAPKIIGSSAFSSWASLGEVTTGTAPVLSPYGHFSDLVSQTGDVNSLDVAQLRQQASAGWFFLGSTDANRAAA